MIDTEKLLKENYPNFKLVHENKLILNTLKKVMHEDDCNNVIRKFEHLGGYEFLEELLQDLNFSYETNQETIKNIPPKGRLLIVANHPIGTLDGLALVKLVRTVRPDVRIVANRLLMNIEPLQKVFLPVEVLTEKKNLKDNYKTMLEALHNDEALIIFPAGEVSRITPIGIRDGEWQSGFIKLAMKTRSSILPIHIKAKNSAMFYGISALYKPLGTMMLFREMFNKNDQRIEFKIGAPIPFSEISADNENHKALVQRIRKLVLDLGKAEQQLSVDERKTVAPPSDCNAVKATLYRCHQLGTTRDGKKIFLYHYQDGCPVMHEIARLRELTFRSVQEGTGQTIDIDKFDTYYVHIVLWDDLKLNIVGAYRLGHGPTILQKYGIEGFYTQTLFDLKSDFIAYLPNSIELGRSFVQPNYWGQHSLEYLWYGIGAYLREQPQIKYLFGSVSISNSYPHPAKELIIGFYQQQFGFKLQQTKARMPFVISEESRQFAAMKFNADYSRSFKILNSELKKLGVKVPTLYKQYVELCIDKGCHFIDFNIDPAFNNCIDSLIIIEIDKIAPKKRLRYIEQALDEQYEEHRAKVTGQQLQ